MRLRSLLFVPGDRPDRMTKALGLGADALILDLEDSVAPGSRINARAAVANFLREATRGSVKLLVRINPLGGPDVEEDISAIATAQPDAIVLPKAEGESSIGEIGSMMAKHGFSVPILPIATETAAAIFQIGSYAKVASQLVGITWGAEDLPAAIGAVTSRLADGSYTPPYEMARALTLFAAAAAGVAPIDTVYPDFGDLDGLRAYGARAARDGFTGMLAIHPSQVPVINEAFSPSSEAIAHARRVVKAFAQSPSVGALQLDGKMVDAPHLKQARRIIEQAGG